MAKYSYSTQFIVYFLFGCTPILNAQVLELNAPAAELPAPTKVASPQKDLGLSEVELDRLFEFVSPDAQAGVEKASHAENAKTKTVVADLVEEETVANETVKEDKAARPIDTETKPVQLRELDGEPVMRGPIHEAFAEPFAMIPEAMQVITQAPPAAVEEIPPAQPAESSSNMEWISGYWAWDTQEKDYIWISGVWRKKPKDRLWLPGRWEVVEDGHQWIPGAWMPTDGEEQVVKKEVLPLPPKSLEQGPASPAPSEEHFWVPGVWQHNSSKYAWRTGYWSRSQKNWVWVPDHYTSVAGGCVFVPGYWDYTWERRGTLYAPCTFDANVGERICYRPTQVIDTNQWLTNLWIAPRSGHYHFGDYHDCAVSGYQPWYQYYGSNRSYYDPFYSYYRWQFPATYGVGMYGYLNSLHTYYGSHAAQRPRVSLYGYDTWARRGQGYSSFGDVRSLARLAGIDLHSHPRDRRHDYLDHLYDRGRDRDYGYRRRYDDHDYGYRRSVDNYRSRPKQPERRLLGYANGAPLYSDQRTGRVKRGEIGVSRSRNFDSDGQRNKASAGRKTRTPSTVRTENQGPIRRTINSDDSSRPRTEVTPRPRPKPVSRPNTFAENRSKHGARQVTRSTPTQVARPQANRPQQSRPQANRPQQARPQAKRPVVQTRPQTRPQSRPVSRPNPFAENRSKHGARQVTRSAPPQVTRPQTTRQSRPQPRTQPRPQVTRPQPRPQVSRPQTVRPKPVQSRPAPQRQVKAPAPRKPSGAGFSTSGMKNSRNKADVMKQRAAMQNRIKQRKGR